MMRTKHIAFAAASLLSGLAASVTYTTAAKTTVPVESGTVIVTVDKQTNAISLADMVIGDSTTGTLRIENSGTNPADLMLTGALADGSPTTTADDSSRALADRLMLKIFKDQDGVPRARVFPPRTENATEGSLSAFNAAGANLGYFDRPCQNDPGKACDSEGRPSLWALGHKGTLYFHVRLDGFPNGVGDNALALLQATETFIVTANRSTNGGAGRRIP